MQQHAVDLLHISTNDLLEECIKWLEGADPNVGNEELLGLIPFFKQIHMVANSDKWP